MFGEVCFDIKYFYFIFLFICKIIIGDMVTYMSEGWEKGEEGYGMGKIKGERKRVNIC